MESIFMMMLLVILILLITYQIRIDGYTRKKLFDIQMEMGRGQQCMLKDLTWAELKKIVDEIVSFTVINYSITNGLSKMSNDELTLNWTLMLNEICAEVEVALSDELKRQILKNITIDYMTFYIKNSVQFSIVYNLQNNSNNKVNNKLENIHNGVYSIVNQDNKK